MNLLLLLYKTILIVLELIISNRAARVFEGLKVMIEVEKRQCAKNLELD